jgi:hypothetical protein
MRSKTHNIKKILLHLMELAAGMTDMRTEMHKNSEMHLKTHNQNDAFQKCTILKKNIPYQKQDC